MDSVKTQMNVNETLVAARALIDSPEKWTTGALARNVEGQPSSFSEATCFCSIGALRKIRSDTARDNIDGMFSLFQEAVDVLTEVLYDRGLPRDIAFFNDSHTHAEVLALFDEAIEKTRGS